MNRPPKGNDLRSLSCHLKMFEVIPQPRPAMSVSIRPGSFWASGSMFVEFPGGSTPVIAAPPTGAKWVLVGVTTQGQIRVLNGEAALNNPPMPAVPRDMLVCAAIYVQSGTTAITSEMIYDVRPIFYSGSYPVLHSELTDTASPNSHPISAITGLRAELDARATMSDVLTYVSSKADLDGTSSAAFVINKDQVGIPAENSYILFERGDLPNTGFRYNEQMDRLEYTNDGTTWQAIGDVDPSLVAKASAAVYGTVRLTANPENASDPVVVGSNDMNFVAAVQHAAITSGNPHGTTAEQIGAAEVGHTHTEYAPATHNHPPFAGSSSERPASPVVGTMYFDTTLNKPIWWSGSEWVDASGTAV